MLGLEQKVEHLLHEWKSQLLSKRPKVLLAIGTLSEPTDFNRSLGDSVTPKTKTNELSTPLAAPLRFAPGAASLPKAPPAYGDSGRNQ